jgi:ADP-L-glycero-D-manno-heptose 6-epimerase
MIIVTGGAGFIGSNLVAALQEKKINQPIVVCDAFGHDEKWQNLKKTQLEDVIAPEELFEFLETYQDVIEVIYHLGAISTTTEKDADLVMQNNFKFSKAIFQWCSIYQKRFIYASSAATYGDGKRGFTDHDDNESLSKFVPLNVYAWSKHLFDRFIAEAKARGDMMPAQCVGLKFFNVYGPNEYHKEGQMSVVWQVFQQVKNGDKPARLFNSYNPDYEDGGQLRDFVWVGDCEKLMLWLYDHPKVNGLFNVGTGKARSFKDLALAVFAAIDLKPRIEYIDMPESLREKYQYYTQADLDNLRKAGYKAPFTSLDEGVKLYIQQYLSQPDAYR